MALGGNRAREILSLGKAAAQSQGMACERADGWGDPLIQSSTPHLLCRGHELQDHMQRLRERVIKWYMKLPPHLVSVLFLIYYFPFFVPVVCYC